MHQQIAKSEGEPAPMPARRTRTRRHAENGAQSLEWIGLSSFVLTLMLAATHFAGDHLGGTVGNLLVDNMKSFLGHP
jgi:hypothetical protein